MEQNVGPHELFIVYVCFIIIFLFHLLGKVLENTQDLMVFCEGIFLPFVCQKFKVLLKTIK